MHSALKLLYRLLPLWSHSNVLNRNLEEILDELDVGSAVFWKFAKDLDLGDVGFPSWEGLVLDFNLAKSVKVGYLSVLSQRR
jgi:hypothetical protein